MDTPNLVDEQVQDAPANPADDFNTETIQTDTANRTEDAEPQVDYKEKFSASSREAQRLLAEKQELERQLAEARTSTGTPSERLYPGFEELDEEAQRNVIEYTKVIKGQVLGEIQNDPAISHSRRVYNEKRFDDAFSSVLTQFPELAAQKDDFKTKYFNPDNLPPNIDTILTDVAKIHLFDQARNMGAQEEREKANRIDQERAKGGPRTEPTSRTLDEWRRMAQENPAEFARHAKDYEADLQSGKLRE